MAISNVNLTTLDSFKPTAKTLNPEKASQTQLFDQKLAANTKLKETADHSGLSQLAADGDSWHSLMGQTFGYDSSDSHGDAYTESETLRQDVLNGNWEGLDISMVPVESDQKFDAAFVGGDTADTSDDQIIVDHKASDKAIIEELFHAFERKINPDQEGDTRLVDDTVTFTNDEGAGALDEGELGRTLLSAFKESGEVPTGTSLSEVLEAGGITSEDTTTVTLDGELVSIENFGELPIDIPIDVPIPDPVDPEEGEDPFIIFDPDNPFGEDDSGNIATIRESVDPIGMAIEINDPDVSNEFFNAVDATNLTLINDYFTHGFEVLYGESGSNEGMRDYTAMSEFYNEVISDTSAIGGTTDMVGFLTNLDNPIKSGTQGIQDLLGYAVRHHPTVGSDITETMSDGAGAAFLHQFSYEQLNDESTDGIRMNAEVLSWFPTEELLASPTSAEFFSDMAASSDDVTEEEVAGTLYADAITDALAIKASSTDARNDLQAYVESDKNDGFSLGSAILQNYGNPDDNPDLRQAMFGDVNWSDSVYDVDPLSVFDDALPTSENYPDIVDQGGHYAWFAKAAYSDANELPVSVNVNGSQYEFVAMSEHGTSANQANWTVWYDNEAEEAVVVYKGTNIASFTDGWADLSSARMDVETLDIHNAQGVEGTYGVNLGHGFNTRVDTDWTTLTSTLDALDTKKTTFTGHSLGAAASQIAGLQYYSHLDQKEGGIPKESVNVETYNSPPMGGVLADDLFNILTKTSALPFDAINYSREGDFIGIAGSFWTQQVGPQEVHPGHSYNYGLDYHEMSHWYYGTVDGEEINQIHDSRPEEEPLVLPVYPEDEL